MGKILTKENFERGSKQSINFISNGVRISLIRSEAMVLCWLDNNLLHAGVKSLNQFFYRGKA